MILDINKFKFKKIDIKSRRPKINYVWRSNEDADADASLIRGWSSGGAMSSGENLGRNNTLINGRIFGFIKLAFFLRKIT